MTAIWRNDGEQWHSLRPTGFPDEATLHGLVEDAPQMLPLAGSTSLIVLGREVHLGSGYADLIAVEPSGRLCVIEVKLAYSIEARRAVVSQVLAYAAYLHGVTAETLEQHILRAHLTSREAATVADVVSANDQTGTFDVEEFRAGLDESLRTGAFRLVIVLDEVPEELVRLVGYLEAVTSGLLIDLITVSAYDVNNTQIMVPQRIDPEHQRQPPPEGDRPPPKQGYSVEGSEDFRAKIEHAPESERGKLEWLTQWAEGLEREGLVKLYTYHGISNRWTLLPYVKSDEAGLVTIWNQNGASIAVWRSVFQRCAPNSIPRIEARIAPAKLGTGNVVHDITQDLLNALTEAYREAAGEQ